MVLAALLPSAAAAQAAVGNARLQIAGTRLTVAPASQTVPFDMATVVTTALEGYDPDRGVLPPELRVVGDFVGPEVEGLLRLESVPGEPMRIPRLRIEGEYRLENIRLMNGDEVLGYAEPREAVINVTQILITRVSSRSLTLEEIRSYGLAIDENSFEAINLTFAFGVAGRTFNYNMPLVYDLFGPEVNLVRNEDSVGLPRFFESHNTVKPRFRVPRVVPFTIGLSQPPPVEIPNGGCDPKSECRPDLVLIRPMVGVLLFPTEVSLLHQFFSVILQVENGAPEGDPAVLRDLFARVKLPPGLRLGETEPPTILGDPVPVKDPGPDGELGTGDDRNFLVAGASGDAEVLLEGVKHGTHIVEFDIGGVLEGLPTGPQGVSGKAQGAVSVRDPRLQAHVAHPQVVRANVEYSFFITLSNVGNVPVNLIGLELPLHALSGVAMVGDNVQTIDKLDPGESETVEFRVESLRTGRMVSSSLRVGSSIDPSFEWSVAVGDKGSLSSDTLVLPHTSEALPSALVREALALVGIGYSLAQAPPSLGSGLPRVSEEAVNERIYRLGQVGRHLDYGEPLFDTVAVMAAEWLGVRDGDWPWDELRRGSRNGDRLSAEIGALLEAESTSTLEAFERLASTTHFLGRQSSPPAPQGALQAAAATGAGLRLEVTSRVSGKAVARSAVDPEKLRDLPFAELYDFADGDLALVTQPEDGGYTAWVRAEAAASGGLHVLVPDASGELRTARFTGLSLPAGGQARVHFAAGDTDFTLEIDADADGEFESSQPAVMDVLPRRPFQVLAAVQSDVADATGHVIDVLFSEDVDLATLVPRDPARFALPGNVSNGGLVPTEVDLVTSILAGSQTYENPFEGLNNPRVVKVIFDNPVSPLVENVLTVSDVTNVRGETLVPQDVPVETRSQQLGIRVEGTVYDPQGQPAAGANVFLYERDLSGIGNDVFCSWHPTAATISDANGHYAFDWVRQGSCGGGLFRIVAQDPATAYRGEARGRVRLIGQDQVLNVLMPGRGSVVGRVTYDDGSVPENLRVIVHNTERNEGRLAHLDENGNYDVAEIIVGRVTLAADDGNGNFAYATFELPEAGAVVQKNVTIVRQSAAGADPPGGVRGVVKVVDGTPVFGAHVALYLGGQLAAVERTDPQGRFDFGLVPSGIAEIEVFTESSTYSGLRAAQVFFEIHPDRTEDVEILVRDDAGTVQGHVYRRDLVGALTPVESAVVWASGTPYHADTDAAGAYELADVFAGSWTINAAVPETGEISSEPVTITSAGGVVDRDLYFDEPLPRGGIVGTVLGYDGNPVSGATIHLAGGYLSVRWHHETTTDSNGRFIIEDLGVGTYGVHAMKGDGAIGWATVRFPGETARVTVRFMKGTIKGRTVAPVGEDGSIDGVLSQIAYRKVEVYPPWALVVVPPDFTYIETDPNGYFEIEALAGPYELHVFNAFHGNAFARGQLDYDGQVVEHEFLFKPNGDIRGVVLDYDGETPVAGVRVNLSGGSFAAYDVHTDENGEYHFPLVPPGSYQVDAYHSEGVIYREAAVRVTVRNPGDQVNGVEVVLPIQGTLAGWVEDADGYPVPGAVVTIREGRYPWRTRVANADEEGNYVFDNVYGDAPVTLQAEAPALGGLGSRTSAEVTFEAEDVLTVITLEPTGDLEGVVTTPVDGSPVSLASVELTRGFGLEDGATTGDDGRFGFQQMPLGWYSVKVFHPASGRRGSSEWVELAQHRDVGRLDVELESRGVITGRFVDGDAGDAPLPGHVVRLRKLGRFHLYATTDIDGYFEFGGIPEGDLEVSAADASKRRLATVWVTIVEEDEVVQADLALEPFSVVTGRVHNPPGAPAGLAENVNVRIEQNGQVIGAGFDNPFSFTGLAAQHLFRIWVTENGGLRQARINGRIDEPGEDLDFDLTLQALGAVTVTVTDSFGAPVNGADVYVVNGHDFGQESFHANTGADNSVSFADVREGLVTVRATHPSGLIRGSASGELTLDGQSLELEVVLQDTGFIRGRVLQPDGFTPAFGAAVALKAGGRWLLLETDELGAFEFSSVVMGSFQLVAQAPDFVDASVERLGSLTENGQVVDYGDLVLDDTDPFVVAIDPPQGSRDLPLDATVTITFSEPMDPSRLGVAVRLRKLTGQNVPVSFSWSADQTVLTLTPNGGLASGTAYEVFLDENVFDLAGRRLPWRVRSSFFTADVIPPTVLRTDPRDGAVQVPVDANILVTFSEPVDQESLSGTALQLTDLTAGQGLTTTFQLRPGDREVIVTPVAALELDRDIQLTVQDVRDLAGNVMAAPVSITFWSPDTIDPTGSFTAPEEGAVFSSGDTIAAAVTASDNRGMGQVEFRVGEWSVVDTTSPYTGSLLAPVVAAAGDVTLEATVSDRFGNSIEIARTVHVEPHVNGEAPTVEALCWYDGDWVQPGVEIPIQVAIADDERIESYGLWVDGVAVERITPANVPSVAKTFLWTPPHGAAPGTIFEVKVEARDFAGNLGAATATMQVPLETVLTSDQVINQLEAGQDLVLGKGVFTLDESLGLASLRMLRYSRLITRLGGFDLDVAGDVRVQCGAVVDLVGRGYAGGEGQLPGEAPEWVAPSDRDAGGSHGGAGRPHQLAGPAGEVYDSVYLPTMPGGGGAQLSGTAAGDGGGTLFLDAAHVVVNGELLARGQTVSASGGGAGGTIVVAAASLSGDGVLDASGGDSLHGTCCGFAGPGGGGRVALYVDDLSAFDVERQALAHGGAKLKNGNDPPRYAAPGSLFVFEAGATYGTLILTNGHESDGTARADGTAVELPALGEGPVVSFTAAGADAWIATDRVLHPRWLGAWMRLLDVSGGDLGTFRVAELDASGDARLEGAGAVAGAATLRGVYRFDEFRMVNADLLTTDELDIPAVDLEGTGGYPQGMVLPNLVLRSGSRLRAPAGELLHVEVAGTLTVEEGAVIDVAGRGYAGGGSGQPGQAPDGVGASYPDAGGSHGGVGSIDSSSGPAGDVYDSVYAPQLPGGGGSPYGTGQGGAGGGVVEIVASEIVLDGLVTARGAAATHAGAGAGGTVRIDAGVLRGTGLIDASAGDTVWNGGIGESGNGGGGRVALYVDDLSLFDVREQATARAGQNTAGNGDKPPFASPGTIYVRPAGATYGSLIVDAETGAAGDLGSVPTPLPSLGSGSVVTLDGAGADAWLAAAEPLQPRWLGVWVRLEDAAGGDLGSFQAVELDASGRLLLAGAGAVTGAAGFVGEYLFDSIELLHGAGLVTDDRVDGAMMVLDGAVRVGGTIAGTEVVVKSGASVRPASGGHLRFDVPGTLTVEAGAVLDVTGLGYARGTGNAPAAAPPWVAPSEPDAGGSHGGHGVGDYIAGAPVGDVYDSVYLPRLGGGGGAAINSGASGAGGGVIEIVAGEVVLEGELRARGQVGNHGGAGAGGTVIVSAEALRGGGTIDAAGGDNSWNGGIGETGTGGGGRVALWVDDLSLFDVPSQVTARAGFNFNGNGNKPPYSAPGTIYFSESTSTYGSLVVDAEVDGNGVDLPRIATELPALGAGAVSLAEVAGSDLWVTAAEPFRPRWEGAWMVLEDGAGGELGAYRVIALDAAGRALLSGASAAVGATAYHGEYRFDAVELLHGAGLAATDPFHGGSMTVDGATEVVGDLNVQDLTVSDDATLGGDEVHVVASGDVTVAASGTIVAVGELLVSAGGDLTVAAGGKIVGAAVQLDVAGSIAVVEGGLIDVTGLGFAPGTDASPTGGAPAWVPGSEPDAGGSHGGTGVPYNGAGPGGEVFDSVYRPRLPGGGGADGGGTSGKPGGGVLELSAAVVALEGELRARGTDASGYQGGAGAGGTVWIETGRLEGGGLIDASGGFYLGQAGNPEGAGGGGRVAIYAGELLDFDPVSQARVWGGYKSNNLSGTPVSGYAAPGTIFYETSSHQHGVLVIDNGTYLGEDRSGPSTELPALGSGQVVAHEVSGSDAWVTSSASFFPRWEGAWMVLTDASGDELGTFRVAALDAAGRALLEGAGAVAGASQYEGEYRFDSVQLLHGGGLLASDPVTGSALDVTLEGEAELSGTFRGRNLTVASGAVVIPSEGDAIRVELTGTLTVEAGALIDVSGLGFAPGTDASPTGGAPAWVAGSQPDAGGSHGGTGVPYNGAGPGGEVYDSVYRPRLPGGGGADGGGSAGKPGGGIIEVSAAAVVLEGELRARGTDASGYQGGAGAGGTVWIETGHIEGGGLIDASGGFYLGQAGNPEGSGGGGRVAIYADELVGFDPVSQAQVWGGYKSNNLSGTPVNGYAAPGTVFFRTSSHEHGVLIVNSGTYMGADRSGPATELPTLGSGGVLDFEPSGPDAWVTATDFLLPRWEGAWMVLTDAAGADLDAFRVAELDAAGRARLEEAGLVSGAAGYRGEYRFDNVQLLHGAGLSAGDVVTGPTLDLVLAGEAELTGVYRGRDATVTSGAVVRPAAGDDRIRMELTGTLTIEAGALVDVTGLGFGPGTDSSRTGLAPAWVAGSEPDAGGSHGGTGVPYDGGGPGGEVYDSVYRPRLPGGGGADGGGPSGWPGGGVIELSSAVMVLEGELRARGTDASGYQGGAGAGGTVWIETDRLEGGGLIDASGGFYLGQAGNAEGAGGGGRVAIYAGELAGFDPPSQVRAWGGYKSNNYSGTPVHGFAGAGTVFYRTSSQEHGVLVVDNGTYMGTDRSGPPTELPALGSGDVLAFEAAGADAWVTAPEPFLPRWEGTWMVLTDGAGSELGAFRVAALDPAGRALLPGAGTVSGPGGFRGEYRFDLLELLRGGNLVADDPVTSTDVTLSGSPELTGILSGRDVKVLAGAVVRLASGQRELRIEATGTVTVEPGAVIDLSGAGYAGGASSSQPGEAPEGVDASGRNTGGAHGGTGARGSSSPGPGEVYDSVYEPQLAGAGGGADGGTVGSAGGGVLIIEAPAVTLDGELRSRGASYTNTSRRGLGAGGTVVVRAASLAGTGAIDVSGGDTAASSSGYGGGGRVALLVADLAAFDLAGVRMRGGGKLVAGAVGAPAAAPGTLYVRDALATYGELVVDGAFSSASPITYLPSIGRGTVGVATPEGADLWIEPEDPAARFGVGVAGMWVRVDGVLYAVAAERADRRGLLLEGAAGTVAVGDGYVGFYRFDTVTLRGGALLELTDGEEVGTWNVEAGSEVVLLDLEPPAVTLDAPVAGALFASGDVVQVAATVTDESGVASVTFRFGGQSFTDDTPPYEWSVTAPPVAEATELPLEVEAVDTETNVGTTTYMVSVQSVPSGAPPTATILCPSAGGLLAPGASLQVTLDAADDHEVARVELYIGGELQTTLYEAPYTGTVTAPASALDGDLLTVEAVAYDFAEQSGAASFDVRVVEGAVILADTTLLSTDTSLEGSSVIVAQGTLTVEGLHTFRDLVVLDGAVVTHPATDASTEHRLELALERDLFVSCGGAVDASGRGYLGGNPGTTYPNVTAGGAASGVGGSHGARGGYFDGSGGVYGSLFDPGDPGGGGGGSSAKAGGGVVRIAALGEMLIDGTLKADGATAGSAAPFGAGGSIRLDASQIRGLGSLSAAGGGSTTGHPGGGGGRIALYAASMDPALLGRVTARGGDSSAAAARGAAGTLYVKLDSQPLGELIVDNGGVAATQWTELLSVGAGVVDAVTSSSISDLEAEFPHSLAGIEVAVNGDLGQLWRILDHPDRGQTLQLDVGQQALTAQVGDSYEGVYRFDAVTVRGGARVLTRDTVASTAPADVEPGAEWTVGYAPTLSVTEPADGAHVTSGSTLLVSATAESLYGVRDVTFEVGGEIQVDTSAPFSWSLVVPPVPVATPRVLSATLTDLSGQRFRVLVDLVYEPSGNGVPPQIVLAACPADGDRVAPGQTISLPYQLLDDELLYGYTFLVDGAVVEEQVELSQQELSGTFNWSVPAGAAPGQQVVLRLEAADFGGNSSFVERTVTVAGGLFAGGPELDSGVAGQDLVLGAGTYTVTEPLAVASMVLTHGATVVPSGGTLDLAVAGTLSIQCGAAIDGSGLGYSGGVANYEAGYAPAWATRSGYNAGGSHGGVGLTGREGGQPGEVYDSVYLPGLGGGGGAAYTGSYDGGDGGGTLRLEVGNLELDGEILARGEDRVGSGGGYYSGAGGGGAVVLEVAGAISGGGAIDASGGSYFEHNGYWGGPAGGGRVTVSAGDLAAFDAVSQVRVIGGGHFKSNGSLSRVAGTGTVLVSDASAVYGRLILDSGQETGVDRGGPVTQLPSLGSGLVTLFEAAGADAWVTGEAVFLPRWTGAWMHLMDASGGILGAYRVSEIDVSGRALLAGAGSVSGAAGYWGEYRFDEIVLRHGAKLTATDPVAGGVLDLSDAAAIPALTSATSMTVRSGAEVTPGAGGVLDLTVSGTLTIEPGGALSVSGGGFSGGVANYEAGFAPAWVSRSGYNAGGSHGGVGLKGREGGQPGEVYDSVYRPGLGGGGGAAYTGSYDGGDGGGVLLLDVGSLVLGGEILARGEDRVGGGTGYYSGAGGGGTVVLEVAGAITGGGAIDASGGTYYEHNGYWGGPAGGGRVAVTAGDLAAFDATSQVRVLGGSHFKSNGSLSGVAATGTVLVSDATSVYGRLILDSGQEAGVDRGGAVTQLPSLGSGLVTLFEAAGADAWVTGEAAYLPRWSGAWMHLIDASGGTLGVYRVSEVDVSGRALLAGAGSVSGAAGYWGEYRFDEILLRHGAKLTATDPVEGGALDLWDAAGLPPRLSATSMRVRTGAVVTPGVGGLLDLTVSGTLTIEAGGTVSVNRLGYSGGVNNYEAGFAPAGVSGAGYNAGGSHGGAGLKGREGGQPGEVYDSVYAPAFGGGGGAAYTGAHDGGDGGGVLLLDVGELALEGAILARGEERVGSSNAGYYAGGGAGGAVAVRAETLSGAGLIDVSGGWYYEHNGYWGGAGGGGRVLLDVSALGLFDPESQVVIHGGRHEKSNLTISEAAAPGTLLVVTSTSPQGELYVVDAEATLWPTSSTTLPQLGSGTVSVVEPDAGDPSALWIEPADPATLFDLGVTGMWLRIGATDYRVLGQSPDRRQLLLEGAAGIVAGGESYQGVYKFDKVTVRGGVDLIAVDPAEIGVLDLDSDSTFTN